VGSCRGRMRGGGGAGRKFCRRGCARRAAPPGTREGWLGRGRARRGAATGRGRGGSVHLVCARWGVAMAHCTLARPARWPRGGRARLGCGARGAAGGGRPQGCSSSLFTPAARSTPARWWLMSFLTTGCSLPSAASLSIFGGGVGWGVRWGGRWRVGVNVRDWQAPQPIGPPSLSPSARHHSPPAPPHTTHLLHRKPLAVAVLQRVEVGRPEVVAGLVGDARDEHREVLGAEAAAPVGGWGGQAATRSARGRRAPAAAGSAALPLSAALLSALAAPAAGPPPAPPPCPRPSLGQEAVAHNLVGRQRRLAVGPFLPPLETAQNRPKPPWMQPPRPTW
jgi:hypothetical protein